ncbi:MULTISPECIES: hypothetical protein [Acinetobacter]|uniref:Uncharacterized protein n=1 Tax=Acinetobacter indicus TaxID=756892 RepID=A0A6C0Y7Q1_9GAMM|nr:MULTISPECIES: hypothetical protein [Acinetobacter]QIC72113.1 hypothetical protein FSC09_17290 [Acinetobacter indicus]QKQ71485.1 hypothetical protein E5Y90_14735 [Acinetobacter sp. 10FS3-1]
MFLEAIQNQAENSQSNEYSFPMLVASKVNFFDGAFTQTQIFSKIIAEKKQSVDVLDTDDIYIEITGQVADLPFHARSSSLFYWTALRDYPTHNACKLASLTLHSLRVALFVQVAKNLPQSKLVAPVRQSNFLDAVDACYPNIDLSDETTAIEHANMLIGKAKFNLANLERPSTSFEDDLFKTVDRAVYQAAELLFEKMNEAISTERVNKIRQAVYLTRFTY